MMAELQPLSTTVYHIAHLTRRLAIHSALRGNPLPRRMRLLGEDLRRSVQHATEARTQEEVREDLSVLYRAGTEMIEMHKLFGRTVPGNAVRVLRDHVAYEVTQLQEQLRALVPAVVAIFGPWESRFITTPQFHGLIASE